VEVEESVRARELSGFLKVLGRGLLIAILLSGIFFLLNVPQYIGWLVFNEQYMGLFLGLALCATYLLIPAQPRLWPRRRALVRSHRRPEEAGLMAALAGLVIGFLTSGIKTGGREILAILTNAGRGMLEIAAITGLAGVVIGVL
jgi:TRAP-type uncharacterized transport system fused permease subunit